MQINNNDTYLNIQESYTICKAQEIQQMPYEQLCLAASFNFNGELMAITSGQEIKLFNVGDVALNQIKILQGHTDIVDCLIFSKYKNWLISGGNFKDPTIRLWKEQLDKNWLQGNYCKKHSDWISCLTLNKKEDLLFSSSGDKSIMIWKLNYEQNSIQHNQSLNKHKKYVFQISLNEEENTLISTSLDNSIIIWKKGGMNSFQFNQLIIPSNNEGYRITFIENSEFLWIDSFQGICRIYQKSINDQYIERELSSLQLDDSPEQYALFPCFYLNNLQLVLLKQAHFFYILKRENSGKLKLLEQLEFETDYLYGGISQDGKKAVFWDNESYKIKLYQLQYL